VGSGGVTSRYRKAHRPARAEDGIALLVVLWFIAALTLLATGAAALSLLHRRAAQALGDAVRAQSAADSAIRVVLLQLAGRGQMWATWLNGGSRRIEIAGAAVAVRVELEDGRIDLNTGNPKLLYALFAANGWSEAHAMAFVARIEDWIAPADDPHPGGAELRDYQARGRSYGPRNAPFECVAELRQVLGGERVSQELLNSLTVYTHANYPLQSAAPVAVRRALEWADEHRLGGRRWLVTARNSAVSVDSFVATSALGRLVRVQACATYSRAMRCRVAVVRLTGNNRSPFEIFLWQSEPQRQ
jgi:type II secretory pathway component PulK